SGPKARANGPKGPKTKAQSSAHGDQTSNHFEIDICSGLFSIALREFMPSQRDSSTSLSIVIRFLIARRLARAPCPYLSDGL
ncbi:hypothetical protein V4C53_44265, partial [Paraburkholderia azotifigens]|uniref:hypothetical protein n=1 Tax=Paraburkholderia azotifigens TaxID=2057004 RepID=UPI00316D7FAB